MYDRSYLSRNQAITAALPMATLPKHWLSFPNVDAPSAEDRNKKVRYTVSEDFVQRNFEMGRCSLIFQLWTHVVGELPPIGDLNRLGSRLLAPAITTLGDCVACFRGVRPRYYDEEEGDSLLVYVLNPATTVVYERTLAYTIAGANVPSDACLTVHVRPVRFLQNNDEAVRGVITRLEFIHGEGAKPLLPKGYSTRYSREHWRDS